MRIKYPRTPHLPWSLGATNDDVKQRDLSHFVGKQVVVTEKMDGENTTLYNDYIHALLDYLMIKSISNSRNQRFSSTKFVR